MLVDLQYGRDGLAIDIPRDDVVVMTPQFVEGLKDEAAEFKRAVSAPRECRPLRDLVASSDKLAVVIPDITRPFPTARVLPWLLAELGHVDRENITIINGTGSHRANTPDELAEMVGEDVLREYGVVNHNACEADGLKEAGRSPEGGSVLFNKEYVEADKRIIMGFIEPHFFAGFSGGYKGVFPAVGDIDSIMRYHSAAIVGDERSTWGELEGNPTQEYLRAVGSLLPVDFCINVVLNNRHEIVDFFCGDVMAAHQAGCQFAKGVAMVACDREYPIVVTTNGGFPLDQNLYQTVKGMSAAAQIVEKGGLIVTAARCNEGFPEHGNFKKLLFEHSSPAEVLKTVMAPGFSMYDQWEAQKLALIQEQARIGLYSEISEEETLKGHLEYVKDVGAFVAEEAARSGGPVAVLPEGPMTIPYLG